MYYISKFLKQIVIKIHPLFIKTVTRLWICRHVLLVPGGGLRGWGLCGPSLRGWLVVWHHSLSHIERHLAPRPPSITIHLAGLKTQRTWLCADNFIWRSRSAGRWLLCRSCITSPALRGLQAYLSAPLFTCTNLSV